MYIPVWLPWHWPCLELAIETGILGHTYQEDLNLDLVAVMATSTSAQKSFMGGGGDIQLQSQAPGPGLLDLDLDDNCRQLILGFSF